MSADNWAVCPKCLAKAKANQISAEEVHAAYGAVPLEEWENLRLRQDEEVDEEEFRTLREDYEYWIDREPMFHSEYGAECTVCDFEHHFSYVERVALG